MSIPTLPPYVPPFKPVSQVTPFTFRDGVSYLEKLEDMRDYITRILVPFVDENMAGLGDKFEEEVAALLAAVNAALAAQEASVDERLEENETAVDAALATVDGQVASITAQMTALSNQVAAAVDSILNDSVEVQDPVMRAIIEDPTSQTRAYLNIIFSPTAVSDEAIATNIATPGTQTRTTLTNFVNALIGAGVLDPFDDLVHAKLADLTSDSRILLDAAFASQAIEDIVTTGRLSAANVANLISTAINATSYDAKVGAYVADAGSATRAALVTLIGTLRPVQKRKAWFPRMTVLGPGLDGLIEGWYEYRDGLLYWGLAFQSSSANSQPWGSGPGFDGPITPRTPVLGALNGLSKSMGSGILHSATAGSTHHLDIYAGANSKTFVLRAGGSPHLVVSSSVPFTAGILDAFNVKGFYETDITVEPRNFGAYGDSIVRFRQGNNNFTIPATWPWEVGQSDSLVFGGGWAADGATSAQVLAGAVANYPVDVAVIGVGVNDIAGAVAQATTVANIVAIKAKVNAPKTIVLLVSPYNSNGAAVNALNAAIVAAAAANGYTTLDPWAAYRQAGGTWVGGASGDGTHPLAAPTTAAAALIKAAVLAA